MSSGTAHENGCLAERRLSNSPREAAKPRSPQGRGGSPSLPKALAFDAQCTTATLHHNGTAGSSSWSFNAGQISVGTGTTLNLGPGFAGTAATPSGLTLRAGTGLLGNEKALTFKFNMTGNRRLRVSYDTSASVGGFTSQVWEASANGTTWSPVQTVSLAEDSTRTVSLNLISALNNAPNAHLRVRFSGATRSDGTSTIDNIRFNATPTP